ncbi:MAG: tRNA (N6-threonylcarbamoyladenosine(37)-N6)-methyltransferase TrmO [Alphaproteobacteria bacterium HGW-Alphaproteobacteria-2]|nr:MAG: tRNA (N6-threonylcarbamoyladenosine(37)-N6)-methyltransferase TrmO [Alphaproteobacteria bacterium HGW-Alphaproteobacteria-2]
MTGPLHDPLRPGEVELGFDPGDRADAGLAFIGRIRSPWSPGDCPHNVAEARERDGLGSRRRDIIRQSPRHDPGTRGVFALRSPVRPNPVGLSLVRIVSIDAAAGVVEIDATDAFDGTPLLDIKPWKPGADVLPNV